MSGLKMPFLCKTTLKLDDPTTHFSDLTLSRATFGVISDLDIPIITTRRTLELLEEGLDHSIRQSGNKC